VVPQLNRCGVSYDVWLLNNETGQKKDCINEIIVFACYAFQAISETTQLHTSLPVLEAFCEVIQKCYTLPTRLLLCVLIWISGQTAIIAYTEVTDYFYD
jgi:hypothetical protein